MVMSSTTIQVKAKKKVVIKDAAGHLLPIDATISEEHVFASQATMHTIEQGDNISDHVIKKPIQLTISGVISGDPYPEQATVTIDDTPGATAWKGEAVKIGAGALSGAVGSLAGGGAIGGVATFATSKISGTLLQKAAQAEAEKQRQQIASKVGDNGFSPIVKTAFDLLKSIYDGRIPVEITTGLDVYQNMIMESLTLPRNPGTVRSLPFTASFRQVNIVASEKVTIPAMADKQTSDRATPKQVQGTKQTTAPSDSTKSKGESILHKAFY
jgi:hypothetical protein